MGTLDPINTQGNLVNFILPLSYIVAESRVSFSFIVGGVEAKRLINRKDPSSVANWSFSVLPITHQRGGVTIVNNVIGPGEETRVIYTLEEEARVIVLVMDAGGGIVEILDRGQLNEGEYFASWDGKNRSGRAVAPGVYFIKVIIAGTEQIRKVLVVRRGG